MAVGGGYEEIGSRFLSQSFIDKNVLSERGPEVIQSIPPDISRGPSSYFEAVCNLDEPGSSMQNLEAYGFRSFSVWNTDSVPIWKIGTIAPTLDCV